ncbi:MAG: hypothetical protein E7574_05675 [Ruminococcaceae bacterium]|nr:hypothetical protein [Oscillospiraceae bacterium]
MKRKIIASIILVMAIILFGCSSKPETFLEYQNSNFEAEATLEINSDKYSVNIVKSAPDTYKITFLSPENLQGVFIEKNGENVVYSVGNVQIPIKNGTNLVADMTEVFSMAKENLVSDKDEMFNGVKVNTKKFSKETIDTVVYVSAENSLPIRIETSINGNEINMTFSSFKTSEN